MQLTGQALEQGRFGRKLAGRQHDLSQIGVCKKISEHLPGG
jgi:hypothetical protein